VTSFLQKYPAVKRLAEYLLALGLAFLAARYGIQAPQQPAPTVITVDKDGKFLAIGEK
jgi:hypothetical protein